MTGPPITILMGVYNGAETLAPQLQSFADQTDVAWRLVCSDDGSTDDSRTAILRFADTVPQDVTLIDGPRAGFSANFMSLIDKLEPDTGFVALADQDDIWMPDKLARARMALQQVPSECPALYCARRWLWYPKGDHRQPTPPPRRAASFRNALIENIAPGNTIVLNLAATRLARQAVPRTGPVFAHDWWLYLLISGAGGQIIADPGPPCLLYRQHTANAIGGDTSLGGQVRRKMAVLQGAFRDRVQGNLAAMLAVQELLTPANRHLLLDFEAACAAALPVRLPGLARVGPYRQTWLGNIGFWGAAFLGRV